MKKIVLLFATTLLIGCASSPYMKEGTSWLEYNVGYSDFELGENKYKVSYTGSVGDEPTTVMKYTYRRAKELCKEKGFEDYTASNATSSGITTGGGSVGHTVFSTHTHTVYSMDVECKKK